MKEFFKKIWEKIKTWLAKLWNQVKTWFMTKILPWLKENWAVFGSYVVIFIAYTIVYGHDDVVWAELILALWMFASVAYVGFKLFFKGAKKPEVQHESEVKTTKKKK